MPTYTVATFADRYGARLYVRGYLRWYNPSWEGCRIYQVEAPTGRDAVRAAEKLRREDELAPWKARG